MIKLSQIWFKVQAVLFPVLFPFLEKQVKEPLTDKLKQLVLLHRC